MWRILIAILVWMQVWKLAFYAAVSKDISYLYWASGLAFLLTVWPFPVFRPNPNTEDMDDKGV